MRDVFQVRQLDFEEFREIRGARTPADFAALLEAMEFSDTAGASDDELRELCLMSLTDRKPAEAAELVLRHDVGARLKEGQIRNMASEMMEEKLWEEYPDMSLHERLFNSGSLLYAAFPQSFPKPDAACVSLAVTPGNKHAAHTLSKPLPESLVVRLLADGMDEHAALHRLFDESLAGRSFPEATSIVWIVETAPLADSAGGVELHVTGSGYWLDPLRDTESFESRAYADEEPEDEGKGD